MSSIRKNRAGFWFLDLQLNGKRIRETLETKDKRLATARANIRLRELDEQPRYTRITIKEFFDLFLAWAKPRQAATSYRNYVSITKRILEEVSVTYMDQMERVKAEELMIRLERKMTARGANYYMRGLRVIFNLALEWKYVPVNPFSKIKMFMEPTIKPRVMKRKELEAFFAKLKEDRPQYFDLFLVYLFTGMRRGEALQLEWEDVDFENDTLTVHGKGDKYRLIPMMPVVKNIFLKLRDQKRPFSWDGSTITHIFNRIRVKAEIAPAKLHDMRKTFSTMLADHGFSSLLITQWLGHEDDVVTRTHYLGFNEESVRGKMEIFQREVGTSILDPGK